MALRVAYGNVLRGLTAADMTTSPTPADGYSLEWIVSESMGQGFRTASAGFVRHVEFDLGDPTIVGDADTPGLASAWNVQGATSGPSAVYKIEVYGRDVPGPGQLLVTMLPNERGDYIGELPEDHTWRYWRFSFFLSPSEPLIVGCLRLDRYLVTLGRSPRSDRRSEDDETVRNELVDGSEDAEQQRQYRTRIALEWPDLREEHLEQILAVKRAVRGGLHPLVLIPDSNRAGDPHREYHLGKIQDAFAWEHRHPLRSGVRWDFAELGRR